ncbi:MAG TPA: Crp/Fnr family transcriptional regulator [Ruminococcaceae bacterium]|nr:Crp/Fnr family transcriptional regulator [Oscillospiraceae bacterium]
MPIENHILEQSALFENVKGPEIQRVLHCLGATTQKYPKNKIVLTAGTPVNYIGFLMNGVLQIAREDENGNRNILDKLVPGELFAEVFACIGGMASPITVLAETDSHILFLDCRKMLHSCESACAAHAQIIENLLRLIAQKTLSLNEKIDCIGQRTLREKIWAFLILQQRHTGKKAFSIPFSRAEMADYLCVDRSALSATLSRMQEEGCLLYNKNHFELLRTNL